jgi:hypothetical protein
MIPGLILQVHVTLLFPDQFHTRTYFTFIFTSTDKPALAVTSIQQLPVLKGHLSYKATFYLS